MRAIAQKFNIDRSAFAVLILTIVCIFILSSETIAQATLRANGKIAFTSSRDGNTEIYLMNPDGSKQKRITNNSIVDEHPTWSPDGRQIAYISQRPTGEYAIFKMKADGTGKTEITPVDYHPVRDYGSGWTISWSPDGHQLAFRDGALPGNIYIVNSDGSGRRYLTTGRGPEWSPDGSKILFITGDFPGALHTIMLDGTGLKTLPPIATYPIIVYYDVTWSPTGSEIAITVFDGANEYILITDAEGSNDRLFAGQCAPSPLGCSRVGAASWSPNGRTIAFLVYGVQSGMEIYAEDIQGSEARLTDTGGDNQDPSWQPLTISPGFTDLDREPGADTSEQERPEED